MNHQRNAEEARGLLAKTAVATPDQRLYAASILATLAVYELLEERFPKSQ